MQGGVFIFLTPKDLLSVRVLPLVSPDGWLQGSATRQEVFMRALYAFALLLPCPALADTIAVQSRVTDVTVYPYGAEVTRQITFTAPAGRHDLLVTDLPAETPADMIRMTPADGLSIGAYALRTDRLPPRDDDALLSPAQVAAKAEVERLEGAVRDAQSAYSGVGARIEAAEAKVAFLRGVAGDTGDAMTAATLKEIAAMISAEVAAARQEAIAAQPDLAVAEKAVIKAQEDLAAAQAAFDALARPDAAYAALSVAVTAAAAGETTLTLRHFVENASWQPVYDLALTRKGGNALTIARGVLVSQYSGEDWSDVNLTLSTAQPSAQSQPSELWPEYRRIEPEVTEEMLSKSVPGVEMAGASAPVADGEPEVVAQAEIEGDVVVYRYPSAVDVATGVEDLRLALDEISLTPEVEARAVPRADRTAFVMATFTNTTGEILLPGTAYLMREGTLVGATTLETVAPGMEAEVPFGAIDGLRLTRDMPTRAEGDRGFISTSRQIEETAMLKVENLTEEAWPVRLIDLVPYSEQEDLEITYQADPAPTEIDVDGQRGILAWEFDLAPGETRAVTLSHTLRWPEGMVLQ
jgi:uncharacterized protein (TIGR02231 family)